MSAILFTPKHGKSFIKMDLTIWKSLILIIVTSFLGVLNTMAGGGSLILLPILILMGMPTNLANGTNRVAILVQTLTSTAVYHQKKLFSIKTALKLGIPTLIGAIIGSLIAVQFPENLFQIILGIVLLIVASWLIFSPYAQESTIHPLLNTFSMVTYIAFFFTGVYGGFIQAGVGYIILFLLNACIGFSLMHTNVYKSIITAIYTPATILIFVCHGQIDWKTAIILSIGHGIGGLIGGHLTIRIQEKWIRLIVILSLFGFGIRLLWDKLALS